MSKCPPRQPKGWGLAKAAGAKGTHQGRNSITSPMADEEEGNEGDRGGGYGNEEHLLRVLALVEMRWNFL